LDEHIFPHHMLHICPHLGVRFLTDTKSWNVNEGQIAELWGRCSKYWANWLL